VFEGLNEYFRIDYIGTVNKNLIWSRFQGVGFLLSIKTFPENISKINVNRGDKIKSIQLFFVTASLALFGCGVALAHDPVFSPGPHVLYKEGREKGWPGRH